MFVSIIIPNYNHKVYLRERIDSILIQTYQKFEVIILDDCSTDDSREIIEQYRQSPKVTQIIYNKKNGGSTFKQWQKGIELSKGDFIWIAESDDYADSRFLEKMLTVLTSNSHLGFVYCNTNIVSDDASCLVKTYATLRNKMYNTLKWNHNYIKDGKEEIKENLLIDCTVNNASSVLFRKQALLNVNSFDRDLNYVGDWYCYLKLCMQYKIGYLNEALNYYREHPANASKNLKKNLQFVYEYFNIYDWALREIDFIDVKIIKKYFIPHIRHSLIKNWRSNIKLYKKLFKLNPNLFMVLFKYNTKAALHKLKRKS